MRRPLGPIGHCSEKLRKAVEIDEEEALLGTVRIKRRPKELDEEEAKKAKKGSGRFSLEPDFQVPGPFSSRPLSPSGHVSFHFSRDTVTKVSDNVSIVSTSSGSKRLTGAAPADHDGYIGRPGAVMALSAAEFEVYAVRGKAVEEAVDRQAAVLSNISADPQVRRDFWLKVHKQERTPEPDALEFRRDRLSTNDWVRISTLDTVPANVRQLAAEMAASGESGKGKSKPDAVLQMDRAKAAKVIKAIRDELDRWNGKKPPVRLRKGRGGRTQFRLTAEFAEGLDGAARLRIATEFCARLGEIGVMYTAAIHEPDEHNDEKNFHLHVAYYDRPARIMPGSGLWDFEVCEKVPNQHERYRYPERQPKIGKLVRDPDGGNFREYAADQVYGLRELFAQLSNEELKKAGSTRLFDPRTYKEMGVDQKPTRPLGPKAASLQAVGVPTVIGTGNAEILCTAALQHVRRDCALEAEKRAALRNRVAEALAALPDHGRHAPGLAAASARFEQAAAILNAHDLESREYDVWLHIVEAGPAKTVATCSRILSAIEAGTATRSDQRQKAAIEARKVAAEAFLADVGAIHEGNKDVLQDIRRQLADARESLADADAELTGLLDCEVSPDSSAFAPEEDLTACPEVSKNQERPSLDEAHSPEASTIGQDDREPGPEAKDHAPAQNAIRDQVDAVLQRILDEDRPITLPDNADDRYRVQGISRAEFQLLSNQAFHPWVQARLKGISEIQQKKMENAARLLAHLGEEGLCRMAEKSFLYKQVKDHADAYREHAAFQAKVIEAKKKLGKDDPADELAASADQPHRSDQVSPARLVEDRRGKEGLLSRWFRPAGEPVISVTSQTVTPSWTPAAPIRQTSSDDRNEAILAFADTIRNDRGVRLVQRGRIVHIDPTSIPDWSASLSVFGDEEVVREAIADRWVKEIERKNAVVRQQIIAAVHASSRRPVEQMSGRWVVSRIDPQLIKRANEWQEHPDLVQVYKEVDRAWRDVEAATMAELARYTVNTKESGQVAAKSSVIAVSSPEPGPSLAQQAHLLSRDAGLSW